MVNRAEATGMTLDRHVTGRVGGRCTMLATPVLANVALMWVAVELTTLLPAFLVGFEDTPKLGGFSCPAAV